jgi:hypothetical protein
VGIACASAWFMTSRTCAFESRMVWSPPEESDSSLQR